MAKRTSQPTTTSAKLIGVIADEDTCVGFLLGGVGEIKDKKPNFFVVNRDTKVSEIEDALRRFTKRGDIEIIFITSKVAELIRPALNAYKQLLPVILEIPSKDDPYDPSKDPIIKRAHDGMFNATDDLPDVS
uniref:V-type proton ATPase subunit F n=1 Tax=Graphocephala atropunctata TaxID=36148 RepID=A0A1B6MHC8_9HEMI